MRRSHHRCDRIYVAWLVTYFLPDVDADTQDWIHEQAAEFRPVAGEGNALPVAAAS